VVHDCPKVLVYIIDDTVVDGEIVIWYCALADMATVAVLRRFVIDVTHVVAVEKFPCDNDEIYT
jgi:hypothetical protein